MRRTLTITVLPLLALGLSACSVNTSKSVPADEVASQVTAKLTEQVGEKPDKVECPEDLPGEEGAKIQCTLTHGGDSLPVDVTVTSVEDSNVQFDIKVGTEPIE